MPVRLELRKRSQDEPVGAGVLQRMMQRAFGLGPVRPVGLAGPDDQRGAPIGPIGSIGPAPTQPVTQVVTQVVTQPGWQPITQPSWQPPAQPATSPSIPAGLPLAPEELAALPMPPADAAAPSPVASPTPASTPTETTTEPLRPPPGVPLRVSKPQAAPVPEPQAASTQPDGKWHEALLDVAAYLGEFGGPERLFVEMALELELGAGAKWMRRLLTWGRRLFRRNDELAKPERRAEVHAALADLRGRGSLLALVNGNLRAPGAAGAIARSYDRARLERCYEQAKQRIETTPAVS